MRSVVPFQKKSERSKLSAKNVCIFFLEVYVFFMLTMEHLSIKQKEHQNEK